MESSWTKVSSNSHGHMTKMAAMPIYGKNLKQSSSSKPKGRWPWNLFAASSAWVLPSLFKWWSWIDLDLFYGKVKLVSYAFVWEKGKTMDFSETIAVYDLKLATADRNDKKCLLTSKLYPLGAVCPLPRGYIHVLNREKNMYKIRLVC